MADVFLKKLGEEGIIAAPFGPATVRFVTHLDFTGEMLERTVRILKALY
jgi:threonine aldolase